MGAREALAARRVRETRHPIWIADPTEAKKALEKAQAARLLGGIGKADDSEVVQHLEAQVAEADAALEACVEWLVFRGLDAKAFEDLIQAHPPGEDADEDDAYDSETFIPALLEACALDSDLTAEEWAAELAKLNPGERAELRETVLAANTKSWTAALPKD